MSNEKRNPLLDMDIYKLFDTNENNIDENCSIDIIRKAYRKKALELHPDKNIGNKEQAEKNFVQLNEAFKILSDKSARAAYDSVRRALKEKEKRYEQLDEHRRKLKEQLESREKASKEKSEKQIQKLKRNKEEEHFHFEVERLRKEGNHLLEQEIELINEQIREEKKRANTQTKKKSSTVTESPRFKISWSSKIDGSSEELIRCIFEKYGEIETLVIGKRSSAILEFKNVSHAIELLNDEKKLYDKHSFTIKPLGSEFNSISSCKIKEETIVNNFNDCNDFASFEEMEESILKKLKQA